MIGGCRVANRRIVITGAAGAVGRTVAQHFNGLGDSLALLDQIEVPMKAAYVGHCDLTQVDACHEHVRRIASRLGGVDVLLNVVGGFEMGAPVYATRSETWKLMFDVNIWTMVHMLEAVVPVMRGQGSGKIVNMGARAALRGVGMMGAYCASKAAVVRLTESLSDELKEEGINVNCILPSIIDTPRNRMDMPDADQSRWVAPERIAQVMDFLASPAADAMHGAALPVEGLS